MIVQISREQPEPHAGGILRGPSVKEFDGFSYPLEKGYSVDIALAGLVDHSRGCGPAIHAGGSVENLAHGLPSMKLREWG
jgi:hypothetical protein